MGLHWGPHFPDAAARVITGPGSHARITLGDPVTISGALEYMTWRARAEGPAGNSIRVAIEADGLGSFLTENGNDVTATFVPGETTMAEFVAVVNVNSTLTELIGTYNPSDVLISIEDDFVFIPLEGGALGVSGRLATFWGPHFPETTDVVDPPLVPPSTPAGIATFALRLQNGLRVTYEWRTDIFKSYDGKERRACLWDDPREKYEGSALLFGADALTVRLQLARHAATGATYSLGLPYEETTLSGNATGAVLPVSNTALLDWCVKGQRVLLVKGAGADVTTAEGVIQSFTATTITLDTAPGAVGAAGALLLPLIPVLLEPQQGFARHRTPDGADRWELKACAAAFGFPASAVPGELALAPLAAGTTLDGVTLRSYTPGVAARASLTRSGVAPVSFVATTAANGDFDLAITVPTTCTVKQLYDAINVNGRLLMLGTWTDAAVIQANDAFALTAFTGHAAGSPTEMGAGATVTTFAGRAVWDRGLENASTMADSMHSMATITELGASRFTTAEASVPDWGRQISYAVSRSEWQWMKAFLTAVKGRWKSFWLPTWRGDLTVVGNASAAALTISATVGDYEMFAARGYATLMVRQDAGDRFVTVVSSINNGNGTITLTLTGDALTVAAVSMLSWCELVHLESDEVQVAFGEHGFAVQLQARVVQQ